MNDPTHEERRGFYLIGFSLIVAVVSVFCVVASLDGLAKVCIAPKLFVLQEILKMAKGG
jgi:hypothetical protein